MSILVLVVAKSTTNVVLKSMPNNATEWKSRADLFLLTDSNYVHSPPGSKIFISIIYTIQFIAVRLVKVMERFRVPQLILLNILQIGKAIFNISMDINV